MRKRAAALVLALALSAGVLSGCRTTEPGPTEPTVPASATAPEEVSTFSETAAIPTEDLSQDPRLLEFDQRLTVLGAVSPEEFCANYEEALALYQAGLRPEGTMAAYDPLPMRRFPGTSTMLLWIPTPTAWPNSSPCLRESGASPPRNT